MLVFLTFYIPTEMKAAMNLICMIAVFLYGQKIVANCMLVGKSRSVFLKPHLRQVYVYVNICTYVCMYIKCMYINPLHAQLWKLNICHKYLLPRCAQPQIRYVWGKKKQRILKTTHILSDDLNLLPWFSPSNFRCLAKSWVQIPAGPGCLVSTGWMLLFI